MKIKLFNHCNKCKNNQKFGHFGCPIRSKIFEGMDVIKKGLEIIGKTVLESYQKDWSFIDSKPIYNWMNDFEFDCDFFEGTDG